MLFKNKQNNKMTKSGIVAHMGFNFVCVGRRALTCGVVSALLGGLKMKNITKIFILLSLLIVFCSCHSLFYEKTHKLPEQMEYIKPALKFIIYGDSIKSLSISIKPIIRNSKTHYGVYSFTRSGPHRIYYDVFLYSNETVAFSNIDNLEIIHAFLNENKFSKREIKKMKKRIIKIKNKNEKVYKSQIF